MSNCKTVVSSDLPLGKYYVKEIATDSHYLLNDAKYPFEFAYAGQTVELVEITANDGKDIENDLIYGSVSGKKVDENGEALGGALIGIFKADETEFTKDNAIETTVSADDGSFSFENVPYGVWVVKEIEAPTGYVLDGTPYQVTVNEDEQVIEITVTDEFVRGNISLTKVDKDFPDNKLSGAVFEVYKDLNGDGKLDDGDELLGELEEADKGIYEMKEMLRVVENGIVCSADINYYDSLIKREFPESSCKVAFLIGSALGKQNILTSDVFIAKRVQHFLNTGELVLLQQSKDGFYSSTIAAK